MSTVADDPLGTARIHLDALKHELEQIHPLKRMHEVIVALREDREAHFRSEEEPDGLFAELLDEAPHLERRIEQLGQEHPELLDALASLERRLAALRDELASIQVDAIALVDVIDAHERAEANLFVDILYTDHGGGD